jgi:hypothetical protein
MRTKRISRQEFLRGNHRTATLLVAHMATRLEKGVLVRA